MLLVDRWGKIITANLAAARMLDAKSKVVTGQYLSAVNSDSALQQAVQAAVRGPAVSRRTVLQGKTIQIQAAAVGPEGEVSGVAVVLFDITQQEQAEQQRREFTANVSHELKTPLQSISGYSELIKCGVAKPEDIQPFAERIYAESQRLISLVEDIINLSHLDEQADDTWSQLDLYEEAKEVTESLSAIAAEKQISLTLEGENASIRGVADLIHAIIYNLCDNAIKYNKPNGSVAVSVRDASGEAVLCVRDNGIGIPAEAQDRIFERFYRVDKSHSKEIGGTGLGLSIVKHAAMVHNAKITVDSVPGEGTAIFVRFPK